MPPFQVEPGEGQAELNGQQQVITRLRIPAPTDGQPVQFGEDDIVKPSGAYPAKPASPNAPVNGGWNLAEEPRVPASAFDPQLEREAKRLKQPPATATISNVENQGPRPVRDVINDAFTHALRSFRRGEAPGGSPLPGSQLAEHIGEMAAPATPHGGQPTGEQTRRRMADVRKDITGERGYPEMGKGFRDYGRANIFNDDLSAEERNRLTSQAGHEIVGGAMEAATPAFVASAGVNPAPLAKGMAIGTGASMLGGKLADYAGASPETKRFIEDISFFAPSAVAAATGFRSRPIPENDLGITGTTAEAFGGRVKGAVVQTPEGSGAGVKAGNTSVAVGRFNEALAAMSRARQIERAAAQVGMPQSVQAQPSAPVPQSPGPQHVNADHVDGIIGSIRTLLEEQRGAPTLEAHDNLTKWISSQRQVVDPFTRLIVPIKSSEHAGELAQKWINEGVDRANEAAKIAAQAARVDSSLQPIAVARPIARVPSEAGEPPRPQTRSAQESRIAFDTPRPGARLASSGNETGQSSIEQLTESISRNVPPDLPLRERLKRGSEIGANSENSPGELPKVLGRLRGGAAALISAYKNPPKWGDYEDATGKWSGADNVNAFDLWHFSQAIKRAVPSKTTREAISNWIEAGGDKDLLNDRLLKTRANPATSKYAAGYEAALNLTSEEQTIARNIMNHHDATLEEAQKAGLLKEGVENYVRHVYKDSKLSSRLAAESHFTSLQTNPSFAKKRTLPTYFDAEQLGFEPKDKDVGFLTASHERSFREALAARGYIKALQGGKAADGRPLVVTSWASARELPASEEHTDSSYLVKPNLKPGEEFADYRAIDHPALRGWKWSAEIDGKPVFVQGDMLVHPEIYRKLKNNLSKSAIRTFEIQVGDKTFKPGDVALNLQNEVKHFILSFSLFHQTTLGLHALEHRTRPAFLPELDLNSPRQRGLVNHGLMLANYDAEEAFGEGVATGGLVTKIPGIGPFYRSYVNYLFRSYLPRVKTAMAQNALERNLDLYKGKLTQDQIYALTALQANAAFGGLNYRLLGRNKTLQDVLRLTFMAPDFTEARARFVGQAVRPYGGEQRMALLAGALVLYVVARLLNEMASKNPHWESPFGVIIHDKEYGLRPVQEDLFRAITEPGSFLMNRLSPIAGVGLSVVTDHAKHPRHEKLSHELKRKATGALESEVPIPVQPWLRKSHDTNAQKAAESILRMAGVNVRDAKPKQHHR